MDDAPPIATFSASDVNNQVLSYSIEANEDEDGVRGPGRCPYSPRPGYCGVQVQRCAERPQMPDSDKVPGDQPDYIEDDAETADVDESEDANEHVFTITVSDGTSEAEHDFTLTVTDVDDPAPGSRQKLKVDEDNPGGLDEMDKGFGEAPVLGGEGSYTIGEQIDNLGNIAGSENPEDVLFGVDPVTGEIFLLQDDEGDPAPIDFESGIVTYTVSVTRAQGSVSQSGIIVVSIQDVNEGPKFDEDDHKMYDLENAESDDNEIVLYVLESAAVGSIVKVGKDAGGNPSTKNAIFAAMDEDTKADFLGTAYDLWYDDDDEDEEFNNFYAGAVALFTVDADGAVRVATELDTDADDSQSAISLKLRAYDTTEDIPDAIEEDDDTPAELRRVLKDVLPIRIEIIDTNVAPEFIAESRTQTHKRVSESAD